jgi:sigma-B regulation protein RsbU (phosphoserine phosphatase)
MQTFAQQSAAELLRAHVADFMLGPVFFFIGLAGCAAAFIRRRSHVRLLAWFGIFIGMYGLRMLASAADAARLFPNSQWPRWIVVAVDYVLVAPSLLFWAELSRGPIHRACHILAAAAGVLAILGLAWYAATGSPFTLLPANQLLAILCTIMLGGMIAIPPIARKYFVLQSRVFRVVMPTMSLVVIFVDVRYLFGVPPASYIEPLGFATWIAAIGYEALAHTFANERRLLTLDAELETARQIQASILPKSLPTVSGMRIAALYRPMSAVAGDFYQFLQRDGQGVGVLVADVTGHGVPAALIASMLKVALQSAAEHACCPGELLRELNRTLTPELSGRLTTAAYLWIETGARCAHYASAGHPPLLLWNANRAELRRIESNGLLFGIAGEGEYPVEACPLNPGDRLLMYSDGLTEPENARGEAFGERRLANLLAEYQLTPAEEMQSKLLTALEHWQPNGMAQQDDITLVTIDVL